MTILAVLLPSKKKHAFHYLICRYVYQSITLFAYIQLHLKNTIAMRPPKKPPANGQTPTALITITFLPLVQFRSFIHNYIC